MNDTFTYFVKEELMALKFSKKILMPLISAYLKNNVVFSISREIYNWEVSSQTPKILRFIYNGIFKFAKIEKKFFYLIESNLNKKKTYKMIFYKNLDKLDKELKVTNNNIHFSSPIEKKAFLTGLFLSGGSVNSPKSKTYHLEIRLRNKTLSKIVIEYLTFFNLTPKLYVKNNKFVVYLKKSENISDFLKLINAQNSMFVFEETRINKDYLNQLHRLNNLDIANLKKTIEASEKINKYIRSIISHKNLFMRLSKNERYFCKIKIKHPDWSFEEISKYFNNSLKIKISKSALNHYSRKIKNFWKNSIGDIHD